MAYAFVQSKSASDFSGASVASISTGNLSSGVSSGSLLIGLGTWGDNNVATFTDTLTNTYTQREFSDASTFGQSFLYCDAKNSAAGTDNVTLTFVASVAYVGVYVAEYSGINTTAPFMDSAINLQAAFGLPVTLTSTDLTPTNQPALVFGATLDETGNAGIPATPDAGFTARGTTWNAGTFDLLVIEDKRVASTSAVPATFTSGLGSADGYGTIGGVYKEAVASTTFWHSRCSVSRGARRGI